MIKRELREKHVEREAGDAVTGDTEEEKDDQVERTDRRREKTVRTEEVGRRKE